MFEVPNTILDEVIELTETAIMEKTDSLNYYLKCVCVCDDFDHFPMKIHTYSNYELLDNAYLHVHLYY